MLYVQLVQLTRCVCVCVCVCLCACMRACVCVCVRTDVCGVSMLHYSIIVYIV